MDGKSGCIALRMTMVDLQRIRTRYEAAAQGHAFEFYDALDALQKETLLEQLASIHVEQITNLIEKSQQTTTESGNVEAFSGRIGRSTDTELVQSSQVVGLKAIENGQVAALVLAGGQGTRLGFDGPKGMFDIGLPSQKTLFQLIAERLRKVSELSHSKTVVPFYIMTSPLNHVETVRYFRSNDFFGLGEENVRFFQQGMLPCLSMDGKIIMESKGTVAMAPDGNGGIYPSLLKSGALADMTSRGILYLHVFSIDNALVKPADPVFMGYCISQNADCGNKVVWKAHAHEKVGVVADRDGKPCIVEYSEITTEMAEQTDDNGILVYGAANICNHFYNVDFIRNTILPNMPNLYHIAHKKIPFYDAVRNETVTPETNNGIKLETFIFDVFPLSKRMAVLEVCREQEFAPVKAKNGADSPDTARAMISNLCQDWVRQAGGQLVMGDEADRACEISPLTSYAGEGLEDLVAGKSIQISFSL